MKNGKPEVVRIWADWSECQGLLGVAVGSDLSGETEYRLLLTDETAENLIQSLEEYLYAWHEAEEAEAADAVARRATHNILPMKARPTISTNNGKKAPATKAKVNPVKKRRSPSRRPLSVTRLAK